jgi:dephospho-CoA kinase
MKIIYVTMIIAITGLKRSGKDMLANYIKLKYGFNHVKIATPLKQMIQSLFSLSPQELEEDCKEKIHSKWGTSPREMMNFIGTHMFQYEIQKLIPNIGRTFWIQKLFETEGYSNLVISDLRFLHEQEEIKKHPNIIIRVVRENTSEDNLESEKESKYIDADYTIENNSTIKELYMKCDVIMKDIMQN